MLHVGHPRLPARCGSGRDPSLLPPHCFSRHPRQTAAGSVRQRARLAISGRWRRLTRVQTLIDGVDFPEELLAQRARDERLDLLPGRGGRGARVLSAGGSPAGDAAGGLAAHAGSVRRCYIYNSS